MQHSRDSAVGRFMRQHYVATGGDGNEVLADVHADALSFERAHRELVAAASRDDAVVVSALATLLPRLELRAGTTETQRADALARAFDEALEATEAQATTDALVAHSAGALDRLKGLGKAARARLDKRRVKKALAAAKKQRSTTQKRLIDAKDGSTDEAILLAKVAGIDNEIAGLEALL